MPALRTHSRMLKSPGHKTALNMRNGFFSGKRYLSVRELVVPTGFEPFISCSGRHALYPNSYGATLDYILARTRLFLRRQMATRHNALLPIVTSEF
jgi:hypothetical protein